MNLRNNKNNFKKSIALLLCVAGFAVIFTGCERIELAEYDATRAVRKTETALVTVVVPDENLDLFDETGNNSDDAEPTLSLEIDSNPLDLSPLIEDDSYITSASGLCYDLSSETLIYGKNIDDRAYPASITKLVTALVAMENLPDTFVFTVGSELELLEPGSSVAQLRQGQKLGLEAMLTALIIPSGNDAAYTIAVNVARRMSDSDSLSDSAAVDYFVDLMNKYAKEIGATNTQFFNPDGFHNDEHYSTARDLLKLSIKATENELIAKICNQKVAEVQFETGENASWENFNSLMQEENTPFVGLKTGYTDIAGFCFAGHAMVDDKDFITITLNAEDADIRDEDQKALLIVAEEGKSAIEVYVDDGEGENSDDNISVG